MTHRYRQTGGYKLVGRRGNVGVGEKGYGGITWKHVQNMRTGKHYRM